MFKIKEKVHQGLIVVEKLDIHRQDSISQQGYIDQNE